MSRARSACLAMCTAVAVTSASDPAWTIEDSPQATGNAGTHGTEFITNVDIQVTHIGIWDDTFTGPDGLNVEHEVGLFAIDGSLVVSAIVPAGTGTLKVDQFRYVPVTPTFLTRGRTYVIATLQTGDFGRVVDPTDDMETDPRLTLGRWRLGGASFGFPNIVFDVPTRFMGANMLFEAKGPPSGEPSWVLADPTNANTSLGMHGTTFDALSHRLVVALGVYDDTTVTEDGLRESHQVGLFRHDTGELLVSTTVPDGLTARRTGNFRYVTVDPTPLFPNVPYVVGTVITGDPTTNVAPGSHEIDPHPDIEIGVWSVGTTSFGYPGTEIPVSDVTMGAAFEHVDRCPADLVGPFGTLDVFDVIEFLDRFDAQDAISDLAPPLGVLDAFDVIEYLGLFDQGCP